MGLGDLKQEAVLPALGAVLTNDQICEFFSVSPRGGMRRSLARNHLVLISDPFGLYQDRWDGDVLHYTGMGQIGDQDISYSQNRTLSESRTNRVAVHLLEALKPKEHTYVGEVELVAAPYQESQLDDEGNLRQVWMFPVRPKISERAPIPTQIELRDIQSSQAKLAGQFSTEKLRRQAENARKQPSVRKAVTTVYVRDEFVAGYAKHLAKGRCDLCENEAPFSNKEGEAYLECHHIVWLARKGEDTIENTVALCPNCHRRMHILDSDADKEKLKKRVLNRKKS